MSEVNKAAKRRRSLLKSRDFYVICSAFAACTLIYYFGEFVEFLHGGEPVDWSLVTTVHDIHRLLFLGPIIYAAYVYRVRGGVIVTVAAFLAFLPRALFISEYSYPFLRMLLFVFGAGNVAVLTGMIRNESERRTRAERLVRAERDELFSILEKMEDGVLIIGDDYRIRYMNPSMVRQFGEGTGSYCYEYLHHFDSPCGEICRLPEVLGGAAARWEYTLPDGRTYEVVAAPFVDVDGTVGQLATYRNITERKKVEDELRKLNELKSDLLSNVSHEFKSPLTSIKGIISSLLQKDITWGEADREMLLMGVNQEADRLASLVTNLLNMSKLEAGVWKPERDRCHIGDIIDGAVEHERWVYKKHNFVIDLDLNLPQVYADYGQIRQVLINLLENAAAYSVEGTKITVRAKVIDGQVEVSVSDEGEGISKEDQERIFEKFYRGSHSRKRPGGTGLGLAISEAILLAHGGRIWVESELGHGSTFRFTLPLASHVASEVKSG